MYSMLPRERVINALNHKKPDKIPKDFWAVPEIWEKLKTYFNTDCEGVLQALKVDIREVSPDFKGENQRFLEDGSYIDKMGVHRRKIVNEFGCYEEYASMPLSYAENVDDLEKYSWPDIDMWDFATLSDKIGDVNKTYYIKMETGGLFELAWALRGFENYLVDMALNPDIAFFIINKITDFYCEFVKRAFAAAGDKIDMVYTYDDIADQRGLIISPLMWEEYIKPCHERLNRVIKSYGKTIMYHSCGSVVSIIDRLKKLPIDVLNPLQPMAYGMDFEYIKTKFGSELCFHGGIDIQRILPYGTRNEIEENVEKVCKTLGNGGGYIMSAAHYIQADTPVENIITLYQKVEKFYEGEIV